MPVHTRDQRVEDLLDVLGIKPERCLGFTIQCKPGNIVTLEASLVLEADEVTRLTDIVRRSYKLVPIEVEK